MMTHPWAGTLQLPSLLPDNRQAIVNGVLTQLLAGCKNVSHRVVAVYRKAVGLYLYQALQGVAGRADSQVDLLLNAGCLPEGPA
jgi:hypothetical protein